MASSTMVLLGTLVLLCILPLTWTQPDRTGLRAGVRATTRDPYEEEEYEENAWPQLLCLHTKNIPVNQSSITVKAFEGAMAARNRSSPRQPLQEGVVYTDVDSDIQVMHCYTDKEYFCEAVWKVETQPDPENPGSNKTEVWFKYAGCKPANNYKDLDDPCRHNQCFAKNGPRELGNGGSISHCCCTGDYCNVNVTTSFLPVLPTAPSPIEEADIVTSPAFPPPDEAQARANPFADLQPWMVIVLVMACVVTVVLTSAIVFLCYREKRRKKLEALAVAEQNKPLCLSEAFPGSIRLKPVTPPLARANNDVEAGMMLQEEEEEVQIGERLANGRYGEVFMATVHGQTVAVKKFDPKHKDCFMNECRVYTLPLMNSHDAVLKFLAATDLRNAEGVVIEYWLLVEYHCNKTLIEYLKQSSIDQPLLRRMSLSLASGISFLHTEFLNDQANGCVKPGIAHRDFNSRNILVRADYRLCICDMGFALPLQTAFAQLADKNSSESSQGSKSSKSTAIGGGASYEQTILNDVGTIRYMAPEVLEGSLNLRDSATALRQVDMYAFGLVLWEMATRCKDLYQNNTVLEYQLPFQAEAGLHPTFVQMQTLVARKKARPLMAANRKKDETVSFLLETMEECWDGDAEARLTANCVEMRLMQDWPGVGPNIGTGKVKENGEGDGAEKVEDDEENGENVTETSSLLTANTQVPDITRPPTKNVNELRDVLERGPPSALASWNIPAGSNIQPHQGRNPCNERNNKAESSDELQPQSKNLLGKAKAVSPSPPELSSGSRARILQNAQTLLQSRSDDTGGPTPVNHTSHPPAQIPAPKAKTKGTSKKVPNAVAAEHNRSGLFGLFRRSSGPSAANSLMQYRLPPTAPPENPDKTCNLRTAASLLPQMARREQGGNGDTQMTCLSPSPSASRSPLSVQRGQGDAVQGSHVV